MQALREVQGLRRADGCQCGGGLAIFAGFPGSQELQCAHIRPAGLKRGGHFFIRPNISGLVMVDLDNYQGQLQTLLALRPRVLVETSPGCYQLWLVLPQHLPSKSALDVTRELTSALGGDMASAKVTQVGRLPGSINCKPAKGCSVSILHSAVQDMDEQCYLDLTANPVLSVTPHGIQVGAAAPKKAVKHQPRQAAQPKASHTDRSAEDWKLACQYFEQHPGATIQEAKEACHFQAQRPNPNYYADLTLRKAREHVRGKCAPPGKPASAAVVDSPHQEAFQLKLFFPFGSRVIGLRLAGCGWRVLMKASQVHGRPPVLSAGQAPANVGQDIQAILEEYVPRLVQQDKICRNVLLSLRSSDSILLVYIAKT